MAESQNITERACSSGMMRHAMNAICETWLEAQRVRLTQLFARRRQPKVARCRCELRVTDREMIPFLSSSCPQTEFGCVSRSSPP